jgi:23S rRNA pseudouridine1911/1915/1917 synthase
MIETLPEILYEDNHLIAVNKKIGDIIQSDKSGDESLEERIKRLIKIRDHKPGNVFLGVIHRIDRPVSGTVVFAKTSKALARMNEMFKEKGIGKKYWAIVKEKPPKESDTLIHHLSRNSAKNKTLVHKLPGKDTKEASLTYTLIGKSDNYYLLEIELHTGRHHQIRAQLAKIGCPIKGDLKYGFPRSNKNGGISLHARELQFTHPVTGEKMLIVAKAPVDDIYEAFS